MLGSRKLVRSICSVSIAALLPAGMSMAADSTDAATNAFGNTALTITTVGPQDFIGWTGTTIQDNLGLTRSISSVTDLAVAYAPLNIPSGALVTEIELEACDVSDTNQIGFRMETCPALTETCPSDAVGGTGVLWEEGCAFFSLDVDPAVTIDNKNNTYFVRINDPDLSNDTRWRSMRIYWQRQISPAPVDATFADVPTDSPFFRAIEALASSGITSGCGGDLYCPTDPVTREQMAVFLARALGLHWPDTSPALP